MYELTRRGEVFFLGGTIHVLPEEYRKIDPVYAEILGRVDRLVCEVDGSSEAGEVFALMAGDDVPTSVLLGDDVSAELRGSLSDGGFDPSYVDRMPPHMIAISLTMEVYRRMGADSEYGVDRWLREGARRGGVDIVPLETGEFQAGLFGGLPLETKMGMLRSVVGDLGDLRGQGEALLLAWRDGDEVIFTERLFARAEEIPGLMERLHSERNRDWVGKIEVLVADGKTAFVAVGGAHLFGECGLLALFRERGWVVRRIDRKGLPDAGDGA